MNKNDMQAQEVVAEVRARLNGSDVVVAEAGSAADEAEYGNACIIYINSTSQNMIDYQIRVCEEYARRNGYDVIGEIIDRDGTQREEAIAEAEDGTYDVLLAFEHSRVARNSAEYDEFAKRLAHYGVSIKIANN